MSNFNLRAIYITPILVAYRKFWQIFFSKWRIFKNKMSTISPPNFDHKPSLGPCGVPHYIWSRLVQPFWRLWVTNRQTSI